MGYSFGIWFARRLFGGILLMVCWFVFGNLFVCVCLVVMSRAAVVNLGLYVVRGF